MTAALAFAKIIKLTNSMIRNEDTPEREAEAAKKIYADIFEAMITTTKVTPEVTENASGVTYSFKIDGETYSLTKTA